MLVHTFRGPGRIFGFTQDSTGANLPQQLAPQQFAKWTSFKSIELNRDQPNPGVNANECLDDIEKFGFHITDAHIRMTQTVV